MSKHELEVAFFSVQIDGDAYSSLKIQVEPKVVDNILDNYFQPRFYLYYACSITKSVLFMENITRWVKSWRR